MEIRDSRQKEWFWLDNEYLNGYARYLGETCTVVYLSLCRHADNKTQTCFPSMELIAEENGISRKKVGIAIQKLSDWGIISVEENYHKKNKRRLNNIYTLLSKTEWKSKPCVKTEHGAMCQNEPDPCVKIDESHVSKQHSNNTHINNTHITIQAKTKFSQDGAEIIKLFEGIDPKNKTYYNNKTERSSADFLIQEYGKEFVEKVIALLPKTNQMPYMPSITKSSELKEKWHKLKDAIAKKQVEKIQANNKYQVI